MRSRSKRPFLVALSALTAVAALAVTSPAPTPASADVDEGRPAPDRPNVVVIMTDDMRADDLSVMPNVRSLIGEQGMTFANSFASYPLCCPSRATLLTGQYSHNHGVEFNQPPDGYQAFDNTTALPVALQQAGYHTVHIGKFLNGYGTQDPLEVPPGWSDWRGSIDPTTYRYTNYTLNENGVLTTYADYQTDHYGELASDLVRERAGHAAPFFLNLAFLAPHAQLGPGTPQAGGITQPVPAPEYDGDLSDVALPRPPSFNEADVSDKPSFLAEDPELTQAQIDGIEANYRARQESLLSVDDAVGELVSTLDETGQLDETVIVFTSDNGFFLGEHRIPDGKFLVYEESTRVPLLIRGPGVTRGGMQETLVANIDLTPTILELAQAEPLVTPDGSPLQNLLANPSATWDRDLLLQTGPNTAGAPLYQAIRTPRFVYVEHDGGERELYDLALDPYQLRSVHGQAQYRQLQAELADRLAVLRTCSGATCR